MIRTESMLTLLKEIKEVKRARITEYADRSKVLNITKEEEYGTSNVM